MVLLCKGAFVFETLENGKHAKVFNQNPRLNRK